MKAWILIICLVLPTLPAQADIIPRGSKSVRIHTRFTNLAAHPEYVFVHQERLGNQIRIQKPIGPDGNISRGYKLNTVEVLAIPKALWENRDQVQNTEPPRWDQPGVIRGGRKLEWGPILVPDSSSMTSKEIDYHISLDAGEMTFKTVRERIHRKGLWGMDLYFLAQSFILTLVVEALVFFALMRWAMAGGPSLLRASLSVVGAQVLTLPLLWLAITRYHLMGAAVIFTAEALAVGAETLVYRWGARLTWKSAFIAALVCNLCSYGAGYVI